MKTQMLSAQRPEDIAAAAGLLRNGKLVADGTTDEVCGNESLEDVFLELEEHNA